MSEVSSPAFLLEFVARLRERPKPVFDWQPTIEAPDTPAYGRQLTPCPPPILSTPTGTVQEARQKIYDAIMEYLAEPFPTEILLIRTLPGTGKTTAAVNATDAIRASGRRILYAGPRHDFFEEVSGKSSHVPDWYEWLPRQVGDEEKGQPQTCIYATPITRWMEKGYEAMDFCSGVCGWKYIQEGCKWHGQKQLAQRVIYGQHQHVTLGHPLEFGVLIGDENPLSAFLHEWRIPAAWIMPPGLDHEKQAELSEMLHLMTTIAGTTTVAMEGAELLDFLGGAAHVLAVCEHARVPENALALASIRHAEQVEQAPYFHLPALTNLLIREAKQALAGEDYPHRVILASGHLTLLLRHVPQYDRLSPWIIWLDATGRPELYEKVFKRPVRVVDARPKLQGTIYQITDRANGKHALLGRSGTVPTHRVEQAKTLIRRLIQTRNYQHPALITFQALEESFADVCPSAHFYAARGSNHFERVDALFVLGTPQPDIYDLVKAAKMIFWEREEAFRVEWSVQPQAYAYVAPDGQGRQYPVAGFWHEPELQTILEIARDDEIIQAAHRARPVNHPCDIWLLTNIPIPELPPDELLTMAEALGTPEGVQPFSWAGILHLMENQETISLKDLTDLGLNYSTARKYYALIRDQYGWEEALRKPAQGRPQKILRTFRDSHSN